MQKILLLMPLLLACSPGPESPARAGSSTDQRFPSLSPEQGFPLTIQVPDGRSFPLQAAPQRVLPGNAGIVDFLSLILPASRIAALPKGTEEYSRLRRLPDSAWAQLPVFERYAAEDILSQSPDLVLTSDWQNPESNLLLERSGVLVLRLPTPRSWEEVLHKLELLARLCGVEERGRLTREELEGRRLALRRDENFGQGLRVLSYSNFGGGGFTSGAGSTMDLLLSLAGFVNAASEAGLQGECGLDFEQLLTIDPDILLISKNQDGSMPSAAVLLERPELEGLRARQEKRLAVLHRALFSSTSTELIDAAEALQAEVRRLLGEDE